MKLFLKILLLVTLFSCQKTAIIVDRWTDHPTRCYGDSYTNGPSCCVYPFVSFLAEYTNQIYINKGVSGDKSFEVTDRFLADSLNWNDNFIFWFGGNNMPDTATILKNLRTAVSKLKHKRYIIIGLLNPAAPHAYKDGGYMYPIILAHNKNLEKEFGTKHFLDPRFINKYGNPKLLQDSLDMFVHDCLPESIRLPNDITHIASEPGHRLIADSLYFKIKNL